MPTPCPWLPWRLSTATPWPTTRLTPSLFRGLYGTAYTSCIYGTNPLPSLQDFNARSAAAEAAAGPATIPLLIEHIRYATVRADAFSRNLLRLQNGQVYDVPGRPLSPYLTQTMLAVAPARTFAPTGNVSLVFQPSLNIDNTGQRLDALQVDFGDGRGYVDAAWSQPIRAAYAAAGTYRIKVRITYTIRYAATFYQYSQFDLTVLAPAATTSARGTTGTDLLDIFFEAQPGQAAGTMSIHLATNHTVLTKPLIVAEGFDRSRVAPHTQADYTKVDFLTDINTSPDGTKFDLLRNLEDIGSYDIVFINYYNGTDDILLNTGLFKRVVKYVNNNKATAPRQQNVVLGMSMGGLIARYGLAEMTKNPSSPYGSPDTRLLLLQDSPQRGANIPLGLSALLRQSLFSLGPYTTGDIDATLQEANALLDQPATKQLLLYQTAVDGSNNITFRGNSFIEGPYRNMVNYQAPYRIVAVSQGSQCGTGLFAPYTELIRGAGYLNIFNWPFFLAGSAGVFGEVVVNAIPANGQSSRVSGLRAHFQNSIFFGLITLNTDLFPPQDFSCPAGLLPLDGAAGGTEPIGDVVGTTGGALVGKAFGFAYFGVFKLANKFCFIPTPSGLDINDFSLPSLAGKYVNGVASIGYSRADGFLAQDQTPLAGATVYNLPHLTYTPRNGEWIFNEMQRPFNGNTNTVGCSTECSASPTIASSLSPSQRLCRGTSATFSIPNLPAGTVVSWSATPANNFTVATGSGPTFTTSASTTAVSNSTITATIGPCQATASLSVPTGPGEPSGYYTYSNTTYPLGTTNRLPAAGQVRLQLNQPNNFTFTADQSSITLSSGSNYTSFYVPAGGSNGVRISASASDAGCGLAGNYVFYLNTGFRLMATPNPASTELTVTAVDEDEPETSTTPSTTAPPFEAELYDGFGKKVKAAKSDKGQAKLDVRALPAGLYNLRAGKGKEAISKHIEITH